MYSLFTVQPVVSEWSEGRWARLATRRKSFWGEWGGFGFALQSFRLSWRWARGLFLGRIPGQQSVSWARLSAARWHEMGMFGGRLAQMDFGGGVQVYVFAWNAWNLYFILFFNGVNDVMFYKLWLITCVVKTQFFLIKLHKKIVTWFIYGAPNGREHSITSFWVKSTFMVTFVWSRYIQGFTI